MTIAYADGRTLEAVLLSRTDTTLRVAAKNTDDVLVFSDIHGTWVSEDCEPVRIDFEWQRHSRETVVEEADCICSQELAARLLRLLFSGSEEAAMQAAPPERRESPAVRRLVI